jgi:hypothetical protein
VGLLGCRFGGGVRGGGVGSNGRFWEPLRNVRVGVLVREQDMCGGVVKCWFSREPGNEGVSRTLLLSWFLETIMNTLNAQKLVWG